MSGYIKRKAAGGWRPSQPCEHTKISNFQRAILTIQQSEFFKSQICYLITGFYHLHVNRRSEVMITSSDGDYLREVTSRW